MTRHITVNETIERCFGTESPLAIFKMDDDKFKFEVFFADTVQTKKDMKANKNFICLFEKNDCHIELQKNSNLRKTRTSTARMPTYR